VESENHAVMASWLLATMPSGFVFNPGTQVVIVQQVGEQSTTLQGLATTRLFHNLIFVHVVAGMML
jgi:hypothetical protein